jgi:hypothetical protein
MTETSDHPKEEPPRPQGEAAEAAAPQLGGEESPLGGVAEAIHRAEEELEKARCLYSRLRDETAARIETVRQQRVGEVCDTACDLVRKFPGPSLIAAGVLGFFLGRLFRR